MNFTVIGRYGPYAQSKGATSCYLVGGSVIFDMGSGALSRLIERADLCNISAVVLTHMHSDHICDMFIFRYYCKIMENAGRLNKKIKVYMPYHKCPEQEIISSCKNFEINYIKGGDSFIAGGVKYSFYDMEHADIPCVGVLAQQGGSALAYTADTLMCENLEKLLSSCGGAICDCAVLKKDFTQNSPHISVADMAKLCAKYNTKMFISHLSAPDGKEVLHEAQKFTLNCEILNELGTYSL